MMNCSLSAARISSEKTQRFRPRQRTSRKRRFRSLLVARMRRHSSGNGGALLFQDIGGTHWREGKGDADGQERLRLGFLPSLAATAALQRTQTRATVDLGFS
ncbi:hypothetical protein Droror1_Dr00021569 [Drosera rotundifolia]